MARVEKVTEVIDGDTFRTQSQAKPLRLADVNAPEKGQRHYEDAKKHLKFLIEGKTISVEQVGRDSYGRSVVVASVGGKSVNAAMRAYLANLR